MTPEEQLDLLRSMAEARIDLLVNVPTQYGGQDHLLTPEQALQFLQDRDGVFAQCHGVSRAEYLDWWNDDCSVRCAGTTAKGRRCRNIVTGGNRVDPKHYVEMQGEYCVVHGGETA